MSTSLVATLALTAAVFAAASPAHADLNFVARFSSNGLASGDLGTNTTVAAVGKYAVVVWADVSGTDANVTNNGFQSAYLNFVSQQVNGGAISVGGVVTGGAITGAGTTVRTTANLSPFTGTGAHAGSASTSLSADGIGDWGSTSTDGTNGGDAAYMNPRAASPIMGGVNQGSDGSDGVINAGATGKQVGASDTWEFPVARYIIDITSVSGIVGSSTKFTVAQPGLTFGVDNLALYVQDNGGYAGGSSLLATSTTDVPKGNSTPGIYGAYVQFTGPTATPEPTSLGLLGLGAVGLLMRRRRR